MAPDPRLAAFCLAHLLASFNRWTTPGPSTLSAVDCANPLPCPILAELLDVQPIKCSLRFNFLCEHLRLFTLTYKALRDRPTRNAAARVHRNRPRRNSTIHLPPLPLPPARPRALELTTSQVWSHAHYRRLCHASNHVHALAMGERFRNPHLTHPHAMRPHTTAIVGELSQPEVECPDYATPINNFRLLSLFLRLEMSPTACRPIIRPQSS